MNRFVEMTKREPVLTDTTVAELEHGIRDKTADRINKMISESEQVFYAPSSEGNESLLTLRNGFNVTFLSMSGTNLFLAVALLAAAASTGGIALGVFCALVATALLVVVISDALEQRQEMKKVPAELRAEIVGCVQSLKKAETIQEILKQEDSLRGYIKKCKEIGGRESRELSRCAGRYLPEFRYQVLHGITVEEVRKVVSPHKWESFLPHLKKFCAKENIDMHPSKIKNRPQFSFDRSKRRKAELEKQQKQFGKVRWNSWEESWGIKNRKKYFSKLPVASFA